MMDAKPVSFSMASFPALSKHDSPLFDNPTLFRSTVGSLQYLSLTQPNVAFAINQVCQFMQTPKLPHWQAVKCILRYLKHTLHFGLHLQSSTSRS